MEEQGLMFLLMSLSELTIDQLKEVQAVCEDKLTERGVRDDNNS